MIEFATALETTGLAQFLKGSRWVYPLVNAGHLLGIALLIGAMVPLDLVLAGVVRRADPQAALSLLRPFAVAGFVTAAGFGVLLFVTQAGDYLRNPVFQVKMGLICVALLNAGLHMRFGGRVFALVSLAVWLAVLLLGRMIGYVIG